MHACGPATTSIGGVFEVVFLLQEAYENSGNAREYLA
jgi:hypothetical protein